MQLTRSIGPGHNMAEVDTLEIKRALHRLGLYAIPSYGLTPYPDRALFDGVQEIQHQLGLRPSGEMRPDGPEHLAINSTLENTECAGGPDDAVHVKGYSQNREGQTVSVSAYERGAPGMGSNAPVGSSSSLPRITNPVEGGIMRGKDGRGEGYFGAKRGHGPHQGVDIVVKPGQVVVSPVNGKVVRTNVRPYGDDSKYGGVEIESEDGHRIKMFYVTPNIPTGTRVKAGEPVGTAQDISQKYPDRGKGPMTPHVHVEVRKDGEIINPTGSIFGP